MGLRSMRVRLQKSARQWMYFAGASGLGEGAEHLRQDLALLLVRGCRRDQHRVRPEQLAHALRPGRFDQLVLRLGAHMALAG